MALAHAIMTALIEQELSGSDLARDFETSLGFFWHASHQQIYQELRKLTAQGWLDKRELSQSGKPNKLLYTLTTAGREELARWVFGATKTRAAKDELLLKMYNLDRENAPHLAAEITSRRDEMMRLLYLYEKIHRRHYADPAKMSVRQKGVYLALIAGIGQGQQFLTWCDQALELLSGLDQSD